MKTSKINVKNIEQSGGRMFGQDDDQTTTDNQMQGSVGQIMAPTGPVTDDAAGLSDETGAAAAASTPVITPTAHTTDGFIMDPAPAAVSSPTVPTTAPVPGATGSPAADSGDNGDLLAIKQQALQHLSPLVGHLDQTPEEKFRTLMMMIQASDDQRLLKEAYETAQAINDEKVRAQALLDVVNEINYFTQQQNK